MTEHGTRAHAEHPEPNYMLVFILLAVLTGVEVGIVFLPLAKIFIGLMLVILAFTKAVMVAAYFMHLKFENKTLAIIAFTPIMLCVFLMLMLLPDSDPEAPGRQQPAPPVAAAEH
jgi:cytochrome c oxidase subunit 4